MDNRARLLSLVKRSTHMRNPGRRLPRPPRPVPPLSLERAYKSDLQNMMRFCKSLVDDRLLPKLPHYAQQAHKHFAGVKKQDDLTGDLFGDFEWIKVAFERQYTPKELIRIAMSAGVAVSSLNKKNLDGQIKRVLGIDILANDEKIGNILDGFAQNNARLIKTIPDRYLFDVSQVTFDGFTQGKRWEEIADDLSERFGVSEWNAERIARDQINKLNGQLTEERQTDVGVTQYVWRTSLDDRVRETHEANEGKTIDWDDPPSETGHPGEDIMCRCWAEPVLDDLVDDT
jgi:SPP1 gp7 family putative phage head morphogenesis protein